MEGAIGSGSEERTRLAPANWVFGKSFKRDLNETDTETIHFNGHTQDLLWGQRFPHPNTTQTRRHPQKRQPGDHHPADINSTQSSNNDNRSHVIDTRRPAGRARGPDPRPHPGRQNVTTWRRFALPHYQPCTHYMRQSKTRANNMSNATQHPCTT